MSPVRRVISLVFALALFGCGAYLTFHIVFLSEGWRGWMVMASALMLTIGAYWLYEDFINAKPGTWGPKNAKSRTVQAVRLFPRFA